MLMGRGVGDSEAGVKKKTILSLALYEVSGNSSCNYVARWRIRSRFPLSCGEGMNYRSAQFLARMSVYETTSDGTPA
jgi:hypothetical protein